LELKEHKKFSLSNSSISIGTAHEGHELLGELWGSMMTELKQFGVPIVM
jgi:hypothetical protein